MYEGFKTLKEPVLTYHPDDDPGEPPSGRCNCDPKNWRPNDSLTDVLQMNCGSCGNHWHQQGGIEVEGPPFHPYIKTLVAIDSAKYGMIEARRRARYRPHPSRADRATWWKDPKLNPLCDGALDPGFDPAGMARAVALHQRELFRLCHEAGDTEAVFQCVADDPAAFEADWIIAVREDWGRIGSTETIKNLSRLLKSRDARRTLAEGRPPGVPWSVIVKDVETFLRMNEPEDYDRVDARIAHANAGILPDKPRHGYRLWGWYSPFVQQFTKKCGSALEAREFLRLLTAPRPSPRTLPAPISRN